MGWRRQLFHRQLCGGTRGAFPSAAPAAQRGLCPEPSCAAIDQLLGSSGGRSAEGEGWEAEVFGRPAREHRAREEERALIQPYHYFYLGIKPTKHNKTDNFIMPQPFCGMTTLIAKAD